MVITSSGTVCKSVVTKLKMKNLIVLCLVVLLCTSLVAGKFYFSMYLLKFVWR